LIEETDMVEARMTNTLLLRHGKIEVKERADGLSDGSLLERYLTGAEAESQEAFRTLVVRHGPMVFGICRHVLNEEHEAEDAFQATFLVLAQKGGTIRNRRVLAGWLHEVAHRIAIKARVSSARRRTLERQAMAMTPAATESSTQSESAAWNELRPVLHAEIDRLPDKYRLPVILSYLEGKTNEEVADLLQWPVGTVKGRLSRARDVLRSRLTRRGLTLSAVFLLSALSQGRVFAEVVPAELVKQTVRLAGRYGRRSALATPESSKPEPATEKGLPEKLATLIRVDPQHLVLGRRPPAWLVISVVSLGLSVGIGVAAARAGGLSNLGSALSEIMPGRGLAGGSTCH
jgi:RNA polymerase sigma factor (sigma-70 family)